MSAHLEILVKRLTHQLELNNRLITKKTWVKVGWIVYLTGWNLNKMRQARDQGLIQFRKTKEGTYEYLLESIPEQFIIKKVSQ
jgi:hypothetical protein